MAFPTRLKVSLLPNFANMFSAMGGIAEVLPDEFTPLDLFQSSEQGAWYDPSDLTTLFQDAAGTTPVVSDGDPVGLMQDKSGNGNDAIQSTSSARPTYRTDGELHWLEFDGIDDNMSTSGNFGLSLNSAVFSSVAFLLNDINVDFTTIFSQNSGSNRDSLALLVGDKYAGAGSSRVSTDVWLPAGIYGGTDITQSAAHVATWMIDDWADHFTSGASLYLDGVGENISTFSSGTPPVSLTDAPLIIGEFGLSFPTSRLDGNFYGAVLIRDDAGTQDERGDLEQYLADKSGVTL